MGVTEFSPIYALVEGEDSSKLASFRLDFPGFQATNSGFGEIAGPNSDFRG